MHTIAWGAFPLWKMTEDATRMFEAQLSKANIDSGNAWTKSKLDDVVWMLDANTLIINESQIPREWLPRHHGPKQPQQPLQTTTSTTTMTPGGGGRNKQGNPQQRIEWVQCGFCHPIIGNMWDQFVAKHKEHGSLQ